jgi:glutamate synthase domain-containing protein 3
MDSEKKTDRQSLRLGQKPVAVVNRWLSEHFSEHQVLDLLDGPAYDFFGSSLRGAGSIQFHGSLSDYCLGAMAEADVTVLGSVGHGLATLMQSGTIQVRGDVGDCVMSFARGGLVGVAGNAGRRAGVAMQDGALLVQGSANHQVGFGMKGGLIVVHGSAGMELGKNMHGGSIYVQGEIGSLADDVEEERFREADRLRLSLVYLKVGIALKPTAMRVFRVKESR